MSETIDFEELRASIRDVLADSVQAGEIRQHVDSGASRSEALWRKAAELGWFALLTPEAHGGLELSRTAAAALYEELGRVAAPLPLMPALAVTEIVARFGSSAQQAEWLPRLAAGESATFSVDGHTPDAVAGPQIKDGALTGDVQALLDGAEASLLLTPVGDGPSGRWLLVDPSSSTRRRLELVDRTRGLADVQLERAPAELLDADASNVARVLRVHASVALACDSIGGAKAVLDITIDYLKMREQFGKPIGSFQALKHRCAEHKVAIESTDALLAHAVSRWANDEADAELYAALVKALACDVYAAVATDAVQLHGGIGFTWEHTCHLYLKRAKLNQLLFGAGAQHRDAAARLLVA